MNKYLVIVLSVVLSLLLSVGSMVAIIFFVPISTINRVFKTEKVGLLNPDTISTATVISDFPAIYNTMVALFDAGKIDASTTTIPSVTTLENLVTTGTISSGTWQGTTVGVAYGGTGSTTLASNQVLLGNGTSAVKAVSLFGTAGQFLTSNGLNTAPSWQSSTVNQTDNYTWTGEHAFTASSSFSGRIELYGTSGAPLVLNGNAFTFQASSPVASSTYLATDASGNTSWNYLGWDELGETILSSSNASTTVSGLPCRQDLVAVFWSPGFSVDSPFGIRFNGDGLENYGYRAYLGYELQLLDENQRFMFVGDTNGSSTEQYYTFRIRNVSDTRKSLTYDGFIHSESDSISPTLASGAGTWHNTSDCISSMSLVQSVESRTFDAGTRLTVYGKRD